MEGQRATRPRRLPFRRAVGGETHDVLRVVGLLDSLQAAEVRTVELRQRRTGNGVVGVQVEVVEVLALLASQSRDLSGRCLDGGLPEGVIGRVEPGKVEVERQSIGAVGQAASLAYCE